MPPLVGRDSELASIDRFLRSVGEGYHAVVFRGGAGYGKSALLEEAVARARAAGFQAVEFLFPYDFPAAEIAARLKDNGLQQVLFNAPPGDWGKGERGQAALPGRSAEFREGVKKALDYAAALACPLEGARP